MYDGKVTRTITSADGRVTVDIVARTDGRYQFHMHRLDQQPDEARWIPVSTSGLFATHGDCEAEAALAAES